MKRIKELIRFLFSREVITYVIAGVLTTLVNLAVFTLLSSFRIRRHVFTVQYFGYR